MSVGWILKISFFFTLFLCTCEKENQKNNIKPRLLNTVVVEKNTDEDEKFSDEVFIDFLEKFSKNATFQLKRVVFPMEVEVLDNDNNPINETITKEDYYILNFIHFDLQDGTNKVHTNYK
jgi:basic membrane lipoprotein Med (substrate-binding protein (PBP1-ABC) superfamily)